MVQLKHAPSNKLAPGTLLVTVVTSCHQYGFDRSVTGRFQGLHPVLWLADWTDWVRANLLQDRDPKSPSLQRQWSLVVSSAGLGIIDSSSLGAP